MNYKIAKGIITISNLLGLLISGFSVFIMGGGLLFSGLSDAPISFSTIFQSASPFIYSVLYEFLIYGLFTRKLEDAIKDGVYESKKALTYDIYALCICILALIPMILGLRYLLSIQG